MPDKLSIEVLRGGDVRTRLDALAALRSAVFRDWPYLYQADDPDYERAYLAAYARSPGSVFVLAVDDGQVVGAATGVPLADDDEAFQRPFRERGIAPETVFYFGESVLLPPWRGRGIGHRFFDAREAHARRLGGFAWTAFCAVERSPEDPRRPAGARSLEPFWRRRGYSPQPQMQARLDWKEVGQQAPTEHRLTFWLRRLASGADQAV